MTYRKILLILLTAGTAAFACGGWWSHQTWSDFGTPLIAGAVRSSTICFVISPEGLTGYDHFYSSYPAHQARKEDREIYGTMGIFDIGMMPASSGGIATVNPLYHGMVPMWMPYLLFVAGSCASMGYLDRLSRRGMERKLAEIHAANTPQG